MEKKREYQKTLFSLLYSVILGVKNSDALLFEDLHLEELGNVDLLLLRHTMKLKATSLELIWRTFNSSFFNSTRYYSSCTQ